MRSLALFLLALSAAAQDATVLKPARVFDGDTSHEAWEVRVRGGRGGVRGGAPRAPPPAPPPPPPPLPSTPLALRSSISPAPRCCPGWWKGTRTFCSTPTTKLHGTTRWLTKAWPCAWRAR